MTKAKTTKKPAAKASTKKTVAKTKAAPKKSAATPPKSKKPSKPLPQAYVQCNSCGYGFKMVLKADTRICPACGIDSDNSTFSVDAL